MFLKKGEFSVRRVGDLETITIDKKALTRWLALCNGCSREAMILSMTEAENYYEGKADAVADILKYFDDEEKG